jgi:tRNA 2-thiocytidine biosynthesis protein TtcA
MSVLETKAPGAQHSVTLNQLAPNHVGANIAEPSKVGPSEVGSVDRRESLEHNKLNKRIRRLTGQAIADYNMIEAGDKVMVCLSGGKDSYTLLDMLLQLQKKAPVHFEIIAVNLDQKHPGYPEHILPDYLRTLGIEFHILEQDTYSVVKRVVPDGKTMCGLCSRLRRGALYTFAAEHRVTKIALGHHRDDIVQTLFLNMFYGSKISGMPPKLKSDDGRNIVIRPLAYVPEVDIEAYAELRQFPIIPCNLCGSQESLQRQVIKDMLLQWEKQTPGRVENIFRSMQNIRPSQLADRELFDFQGLGAQSTQRLNESDWLGSKTAFDADTPAQAAKKLRLFDIPVEITHG